MRTAYMKFTIVLAVLVVMLCTSIMGVHNVQNTAYASDENYFDNTNVYEDLTSSTTNGEPFDIRNYAFNESKQASIFSFVEYCYSFKANMRSNYGLYIYVYNPQGKNFATNTKQNKIQMATEYRNGVPSRYDKFELKYCGKVEETNYKGLFYKFKIVNAETFLDKVNSNERRYDVSGFELVEYGKQNAKEYGVGGTYKFTGYSKGYGPDANAESTLTCVVDNLETCELEVHHTYFRTDGVSNLGSGHYNEVNTVYFELPNHFLEDYGNLQKIRAEWWEYKTQMAFVTDNNDFVNLANQYKYADASIYNPDQTNVLYRRNNKDIPFYAYAYDYWGSNGTEHWDHYWTYNLDLSPVKIGGVGSYTTLSSDTVSTRLPFVFYSQYQNEGSIFDFLMSHNSAGSVEGSVVANAIYSYEANSEDYIDCNGRPISKYCFVDDVDAGRTRGYNDVTIDLEDTFDLDSYDSNHSWWDKLWNFGINAPNTSEEYHNVNPIVILTGNDLLGTDSEISRRLLVNSNDINDLRTVYAHAQLNDCTVVLFRFANTDYFTVSASAQSTNDLYANGYAAQMTVFLDFDIIELTFNKDGEYTVIPVVASPIDIINSLTPPPKSLDWWKVILAVILLILLLLLLIPILPYIIKGVVWFVSAPIKAVKNIKKKKEANDDGNT